MGPIYDTESKYSRGCAKTYFTATLAPVCLLSGPGQAVLMLDRFGCMFPGLDDYDIHLKRHGHLGTFTSEAYAL